MFDALFELAGGGSLNALRAFAVASDVDNRVVGRPRNNASLFLVATVANTYEERTGRRPGLSYNSLLGQPGGPFFRLIQAMLTLAGESPKPATLGKTIQRELARYGPWIENNAVSALFLTILQGRDASLNRYGGFRNESARHGPVKENKTPA
jgi:hypothetical protein